MELLEHIFVRYIQSKYANQMTCSPSAGQGAMYQNGVGGGGSSHFPIHNFPIRHNKSTHTLNQPTHQLLRIIQNLVLNNSFPKILILDNNVRYHIPDYWFSSQG